MRILVTGCAGFIGSHLCEALLQKGYHVIGIDNFDLFYDKRIKLNNLQSSLDHQQFAFLELDLADKDALFSIQQKFDCIIHLAAKAGVRPSIENPSGYVQTNIHGTLNMLELARNRNVKKIVFASSSSVYGNDTQVPFSEDAFAVNPISPYAFTKRSCELLLFNYFHLYQIESVSLRFFTVYGPRQRPDLAIHKFFKAVYTEKPIQIFGDGSTYRDYTFIDDIVKGIISSLDYLLRNISVFEVINLGNNQPTSLKDLIEGIQKAIGKAAILQYTGMQPGDVDKTYADIAKAKRLLNFQPTTSIEEGLSAFNDWYREVNELQICG